MVPGAQEPVKSRLASGRVTKRDIRVVKDMLDYARAEGDAVKIALFEDTLNDLLDRYTCHTYHSSQTER